MLYATRHDPVLSPDSVSYLSTAAHLRSGQGFTEFTGQPLTVFGPVLPMLLAAGGRSLLWARLVGATAVAGSTWLMFVLLGRRVRPLAAVLAAVAFGLSQGLIRVGSTVWSETPFILIALTALVVLTAEPLSERRAAFGGLLCGLGFLTRYAGVGLIITGACVVVSAMLTSAASGGRRSLGDVEPERWVPADVGARVEPGVGVGFGPGVGARVEPGVGVGVGVGFGPGVGAGIAGRRTLRMLAIHLGAAVGVCAIWIVRNLIETGEALGPRFSGGSSDSVEVLLRRTSDSVGELIFGNQVSPRFDHFGGLAVLILLTVAAVVALIKRPFRTLDIAAAIFALTSLAIPIAARRMTASDIEFRVLSPLLIPVVYFAAIALDRVRIKPVALILCTALIGWWAFEGIAMAQRTPEIVLIGVGSRTQFSRELYDLIDTLPIDANVLTNNPQRVWWQNHREPTLFAFARPRAGNSNYPLSPTDTLRYACLPHTYLAWFGSLANAGDGPADRRPDLAAIIDLTITNAVPGGVMYLLSAHDSTQCPH